MSKKILVTGASGFIGLHIVLDLLNHRYNVRGSIRNIDNAEAVRAVLSKYSERSDEVEFVEANLTDPDCWHAAVDGCDGVFHIASPVVIEQPKDADELIVPAREGILNVLKAAREAGIKRVVMTSSDAAVSRHPNAEAQVQNAENWSDINMPGITPYALSKTIAERAAWDYVTGIEDKSLELVSINPVLVLGPALEKDYGASLEALVLLLKGKYPLVPKLSWPIVDVRDVASLHRIAFESSSAAGQRLLCSSGHRWFVDISKQLIAEFPAYKKKLPKRELPNFLVKVLALFDEVIAFIVCDLGKVIEYDCSPAKKLGWSPASADDAISSGARSLIKLGIV